MYIVTTKHVIKQVMKRTGKKTKKDAKHFVLSLFPDLYHSKEYKGRKVRFRKSDDGKFVLTDGYHKFVYSKDCPGEYVIITYARNDKFNQIEKDFIRIFKKKNLQDKKKGYNSLV